MVLVLGAGTGLAKDASSAYITTDIECDEPIDLQVNEPTPRTRTSGSSSGARTSKTWPTTCARGAS